jgi:hypothetical protein
VQTSLLVIESLFLLGALLFSGRRTIRAKGFLLGLLQGTLLLYGLIIGGTFMSSVVIPEVFALFGADRSLVTDVFPEATSLTPVVLLGWYPAMVFALVVRGIHDGVRLMHAKGKR